MNPSELPINVEIKIDIDASPEKAFAAMLEWLGPGNRTPSGESMKMKLEAFPGGRWYRDLGDSQGHFWGNVQVIKKPTILEITGPLFMSYPALSHVQFRITPNGDSSTLSLRHQALGLVDPQHAQGVTQGWNHMMKGIKDNAQRH